VMNHTCDGSRVNKPTATHSDRICRCRQSTQRLHRFSWRRCDGCSVAYRPPAR
jgi:hypothetical protein